MADDGYDWWRYEGIPSENASEEDEEGYRPFYKPEAGEASDLDPDSLEPSDIPDDSEDSSDEDYEEDEDDEEEDEEEDYEEDVEDEQDVNTDADDEGAAPPTMKYKKK